MVFFPPGLDGWIRVLCWGQDRVPPGCAAVCQQTKQEGVSSVGASLVSGSALLASSAELPSLDQFFLYLWDGRGRDTCTYQSHVLMPLLLSSGIHPHHWRGSWGGSPYTPHPSWGARNWARDTGCKEHLIWPLCPRDFGRDRTSREFLENKPVYVFTGSKGKFLFSKKEFLPQIWN